MSKARLYKIKSFRIAAFNENKGYVTESLVSANSRAQAIKNAALADGSVVLRISCLGVKVSSSQDWTKMP